MNLWLHNTINVREIDVKELPDYKLVGKLLLEETIKYPGDIVILQDKSYITVEKVNHYYFDGLKYQFAKTTLTVRALERFC
jgi:signal peptidase I